MSKAIINALTLAIAEDFDGTLSLQEAKQWAENFVAKNADLFQQSAVSAPSGTVRPPTPQRPATAADLSEAQSAALASGIGLCPNCQQPNNDHLPACTRATGYDERAVTKNKLNPVA